MSFEAPSVFCITSQAERDWISARSDVRFDDRDGEPFLPVDDSYILTPSRASDDGLRVEMLTHPDVDKWLMMVPKPYSAGEHSSHDGPFLADPKGRSPHGSLD